MGVKNSFTDLHEISGIALKLENETNKLEFGRGITEVKPVIRHGAEMRQVLQNSDALGAQDCYYMYRGVQREQDNAEIEKAGLRYDITILPAILHGKEFNKTFGHFHPKIQGSELTYTEVYEVLHGKAHYILQGSAVGVESKGKGTQAHAGDFFVVEAGAGDKVVVPPNYGHVTINPSRTEPLVMSNWSAADFKSDYGIFRERHGAAYYETAGGDVTGEKTSGGWAKNKKYGTVPVIKKLKPRDVPEFGLLRGKPMYSLAAEGKLGLLDFLKSPAQHIRIFDGLLR